MREQLDSRSRKLLQRSRKTEGVCIGCRKPLQVVGPAYKQDGWADLYHGIDCYEKAQRRTEREARLQRKALAAQKLRYCQPCGARITPSRLRRHPTAKTCSAVCSAERQAQQSRESVRRLRVRQRRVRTEVKLAGLGDGAPCVVCQGEIPVQRRVQWQGIKTCSPVCAVEHQRVSANRAKQRYRQRQKEIASVNQREKAVSDAA